MSREASADVVGRGGGGEEPGPGLAYMPFVVMEVMSC